MTVSLLKGTPKLSRLSVCFGAHRYFHDYQFALGHTETVTTQIALGNTETFTTFSLLSGNTETFTTFSLLCGNTETFTTFGLLGTHRNFHDYRFALGHTETVKAFSLLWKTPKLSRLSVYFVGTLKLSRLFYCFGAHRYFHVYQFALGRTETVKT